MDTTATIDVTVEREIPATPEQVYDLITDVTRMGEWSPETTGAAWVGGAERAEVGAKFKGTNRIGSTTWSTKPTVTEAVRGRTFAFKVPGASGPLWRYDFTPTPTGTLVTERVLQTKRSSALVRFLQRRAGVTDRASSLEDGMHTTLARLSAACTA